MAKSPSPHEVEIIRLSEGRMNVCIVGTSPLITNPMTRKGVETLLLGGRKKTVAEKAAHDKHNPREEFRAATYRFRDANSPTLLALPSPMFKGAMLTAALDVEGLRRTEMGRLAWVIGERVPLWGIPMLHMAVVRSADVARTPDVRTRAIVPRWATVLSVAFVEPKMQATSLANVLATSGITAGVGDFRQEKGKGNYGQFRLCDADDAEFLDIQATGGRAAQEAALAAAEPYDDESATMLGWWRPSRPVQEAA